MNKEPFKEVIIPHSYFLKMKRVWELFVVVSSLSSLFVFLRNNKKKRDKERREKGKRGVQCSGMNMNKEPFTWDQLYVCAAISIL
jgi:hypothetical protein